MKLKLFNHFLKYLFYHFENTDYPVYDDQPMGISLTNTLRLKLSDAEFIKKKDVQFFFIKTTHGNLSCCFRQIVDGMSDHKGIET